MKPCNSGPKTGLAGLVLVLLITMAAPARAGEVSVPGESLHGYSGLWDVPDARVLPDWHARVGASSNGPYNSASGALGLYDRLEAHGSLTEVTTREPFPGEGFGNYKDRSVGLKHVLLQEDGALPQLAVGLSDLTGTALFASRYLVASKRLGPHWLSFGLGQGFLGGEDVSGAGPAGNPANDAAKDFLFSSPFRPTRPFAGMSAEIAPGLFLVGEWSPVDYEDLFGFDEDGGLPVNVGLKYTLLGRIGLSLGLMRGRDPALGASLNFPLEPEALLVWRSRPAAPADEALRWRALEADNHGLAQILARALADNGLDEVRVSVADAAVWAEAENGFSLSDARALGRMGRIIDDIAPDRIERLYLNLGSDGRVVQSLSCSRGLMRDFLQSRIDRETFLAFGDLELYGAGHEEEYREMAGASSYALADEDDLRYEISPMIKTFTANRSGFFKHKAGIRFSLSYDATDNTTLTTALETTLYNDYDELAFQPLEDESARTDVLRYEQGLGSRLVVMALDQTRDLPWNIRFRLSSGYLETAYAGTGGELFRLFDDGRFGLGLEAAAVRKRDPESNLGLDPGSTRVFTNAFLNVYALLDAESGLAAGAKIGRFLAGDHGVRLELRRTWKHFTVGFWYTVTHTGHLESGKNVGHREKGLFVRVPLSVFRSDDAPGHVGYRLSSFTRDPGQSVRLPRPLYPMSEDSLPPVTRRDISEMRRE
jgi:hypothetical protein